MPRIMVTEMASELLFAGPFRIILGTASYPFGPRLIIGLLSMSLDVAHMLFAPETSVSSVSTLSSFVHNLKLRELNSERT